MFEIIYLTINQQKEIESNILKDDPLQLSCDDLMTIRAALRVLNVLEIITVDLGVSGKYVVWYNAEFKVINIQDSISYFRNINDNKLAIIINKKGKITFLKINNSLPGSTKVPNDFLPHMQACFKVALEKSSTYTQNPSNDTVSIKVVRKGLKEVPEYHINKLTEIIEKSFQYKKDPKIEMTFLKSNMHGDEGVDRGGLTRDYLSELMEGIIAINKLNFKKMGLLVIPHAKNECKNLEPLPFLNDQEKEIYKNLGKLITYCYHSEREGHFENTYLLGRHFDDSLFNAALCLTAEEIDTPFEDLTLETKLKMGEALLEARVASGMDMKYYKARLDWIRDFDNLTLQQLKDAAFQVLNAECLPDDFTLNNVGDEADVDRINANKDKFKQFLIDSFFTPKGQHGQLGAHLAPIHAIAQGMKSICSPESFPNVNDNAKWNAKFKGQNYVAFSNKVQGSINREEIANQIKLDVHMTKAAELEISKKAKWLQEWVLDGVNGASEEDLKNLLKFVTGSSSLAKDAVIQVKSQIKTYKEDFIPIPRAHTCSFEMELAPVKASYGPEYNDHTKENFIKCLKELALKNPTAYQMN